MGGQPESYVCGVAQGDGLVYISSTRQSGIVETLFWSKPGPINAGRIHPFIA